MVEGSIPTLEFEQKAVTTLYAVPLTYGGFLNGYSGNKTIRIDEKGLSPQTRIYPGSVELVNGEIQLMPSRSMAFVSKAGTLRESMTIVNEDIKNIDGPVRYRTDVNMGYVEGCIKEMNELRRGH
jgi:phosphoribosylamine-glycine ligase